MKIFSSADAGKRRSSFHARVRRNAVCNSEFLRTTFLQAFKLQILTNDTVYRRVTNSFSREIWHVVLWLFGAHSWLKINSLTESTLSSLHALRGRPLHWHVSVLPAFLNFLYNLFRPETVQPLPGNSLTSFYHHNFWICKNFQLKCYPQHCTSYLHFKRRLLYAMHRKFYKVSKHWSIANFLFYQTANNY